MTEISPRERFHYFLRRGRADPENEQRGGPASDCLSLKPAGRTRHAEALSLLPAPGPCGKDSAPHPPPAACPSPLSGPCFGVASKRPSPTTHRKGHARTPSHSLPCPTCFPSKFLARVTYGCEFSVFFYSSINSRRSGIFVGVFSVRTLTSGICLANNRGSHTIC